MDYEILGSSMMEMIKPYAYAVVVSGVIGVGIKLIINSQNEDKRMKAFNKLLFILMGILMLTLVSMTAVDVTTFLTEHTTSIEAQVDEQTESGGIEPLKMDDVGIGETILIGIGELVSLSFRGVKQWFVGDQDIQEILFGQKDIFLNLNVPLKDDEGEINLFQVVLGMVGVFVIIILIRMAFRVMSLKDEDDAATEMSLGWERLLKTVGLVIIIPTGLFILCKMSQKMLNMFGEIDVESYSKLFELDPLEYGLGITVGKIYITYLELKMYTVMLFRQYALNGLYVISPLAAVVKGIGEEFDSFEKWLTFAIKFAFLPFYYCISFLIAVVMINNLYDGSNPFFLAIVYSFVFKFTDILVGIFAMKSLSAGDSKAPSMNLLTAVTALNMLSKSLNNVKKLNELGKTIGKLALGKSGE